MVLIPFLALLSLTQSSHFQDLKIFDNTEMQDVYAGDPFPSHWVNPGFKKIVFVTSPNFGHRPDDVVIDTVVIHATDIPTLEEVSKFFYHESSQVSSHFIIGKDGSIIECVNPYYRAWHAGVSRDFLGRNDLNNFSIGIELVNLDNGHDPYPVPQIKALRTLIESLKFQYPLKYITSHKYIAIPQGRKNDPMGFDWKSVAGLGLKVIHKGYAPMKPGDPRPLVNPS